MTTTAEFSDQSEFEAAVESVRGNDTEDKYLIVGHVDGNPSLLELLKVGGNVDELGQEVDSSRVLYILARYERTYDLSKTVKFVYIHWIGDQVPFSKKGRYGVVQGHVQEYFNPYHLLMETSHTEDLDITSIQKQLDETAGTKSKVLENSEAQGRQMRGFTSHQVPQRHREITGGGTVSKESASLEVSNDVVENVASVRADNEPTRWVLACYRDNSPKQPIDTYATGEGDVSEMQSRLEDDLVLYGLYRTSDIVDDITTVKFVYIIWVGEKVKPMMRGKISTHKGRIEELFNPAHVTIFASERSEVTETIVMEKVTSASGTRSHVK